MYADFCLYKERSFLRRHLIFTVYRLAVHSLFSNPWKSPPFFADLNQRIRIGGRKTDVKYLPLTVFKRRPSPERGQDVGTALGVPAALIAESKVSMLDGWSFFCFLMVCVDLGDFDLSLTAFSVFS